MCDGAKGLQSGGRGRCLVEIEAGDLSKTFGNVMDLITGNFPHIVMLPFAYELSFQWLSPLRNGGLRD